MPTYEVKRADGRRIEMRGPRMPTKAEIDHAFAVLESQGRLPRLNPEAEQQNQAQGRGPRPPDLDVSGSPETLLPTDPTAGRSDTEPSAGSAQSELVRRVRSQYPTAYRDLSDVELEQAVLEKYPQYADLARRRPVDRDTFTRVKEHVIRAAPPGLSRDQFNLLLDNELAKLEQAEPDFRSTNAKDHTGNALVDDVIGAARDFGVGLAKGAANTAVGLGQLVHRVPGVSHAVDSLYGVPGLSERAMSDARAALQPDNTAEKAGYYGEQIGEFFTPVGAAGKLRAAAEIGKSGLLTMAQGGTGHDAALSAGLTAIIPGGWAIRSVSDAIGRHAETLVRAAVKPTVTALRRVAGSTAQGLDAKANALVQFILENRLTTPQKARQLFVETERELQIVLGVKNAPTDAPTRAARYLAALEKNAAKQGLGADDVAQINRAAAELLEGPMGRDVITMVPTPHPTLVGANGNPLMVLRPQTSRALRGDVMATEALDSARASGRWTTRKAWGELKGASAEAAKAVERAQRDAVKDAVPEARALLQREGRAIQSEALLDRMAHRAGNRDVIGLPAHVIAAGEVASGRAPVLAFAANWLRNNQLKAGVWGHALNHAIQRGNAPLAADILKRLGVGTASQQSRPQTVAP